MKRKPGKHSLRRSLLTLTLFCVLLPMLITGLYLSAVMDKQIFEQNSRDITLLLDEVNKNVATKIDALDDTIALIRTNRTIQECLAASFVESDAYIKTMNRIACEEELAYCATLISKAGVATTGNLLTLVKRIYILQPTQNLFKFQLRYEYNEDRVDAEHIALYDKMKENSVDTAIFASANEINTLYLVTALKNVETLEPLGFLFLDVDETSLAALYAGMPDYEGSCWYLLGADNVILSSSGAENFGKTASPQLAMLMGEQGNRSIVIDGVPYLCSTRNIGKYGMTSIALVPQSALRNVPQNALLNYILIILLILTVSLLFALFASIKITRPLKNTAQQMQRLEAGDFSVRMPAYRYDELTAVSETFNSMAAKIDYLVTDVYQKQLLLREAELNSLRAQINPHFLFNVFQTVTWFAEEGRNEDINRIMTALGEIVRASMTTSEAECISIREELRYVEFYISIQKYRFEDRLSAQILVEDEEILDCTIPKFCLQTMVENAVVHGLEEKLGPGHLQVKLLRHDGDVIICVTDDGTGFDPQSLSLDAPMHPRDAGHTHIGIYNSNKRLCLLYGERYKLCIESHPGIGTKVTIRVPENGKEKHHV